MYIFVEGWSYVAEQLLNCISSAAATINKPTPGKGKQGCLPPALQSNGYYDQEPMVRKRPLTKKRKGQAKDSSSRPHKFHVCTGFPTPLLTEVFCIFQDARPA